MHRGLLSVWGFLFILYLPAVAATPLAGDYTGYLTTPRQGRLIHQELDLRIESSGKVHLSLRSPSNRAITVATFLGKVAPNGHFMLTGRTGRIMVTATSERSIFGTSQINGARGVMRGRPFATIPALCSCTSGWGVTIVAVGYENNSATNMPTPIGSGTIGGSVSTSITLP